MSKRSRLGKRGQRTDPPSRRKSNAILGGKEMGGKPWEGELRIRVSIVVVRDGSRAEPASHHD